MTELELSPICSPNELMDKGKDDQWPSATYEIIMQEKLNLNLIKPLHFSINFQETQKYKGQRKTCSTPL